MDMNRRSVLVGLGTAAAGSGAVFGSGAFSSVEANRSITVTVDNDNNAYVAIDGQGDIISNDGGSGGDGQLSIDLGSEGSNALNDGAITFEDNLIEVTNQHPSSSSIFVSLRAGDSLTSSDISAVSTSPDDISGTDEVSTGVSGDASVTFTLSGDGNGTIASSGSTDPGDANRGVSLSSQGDTAEIDVTVDSSGSPADPDPSNDLVIIAQEDNT